jgi:hypothetical protein
MGSPQERDMANQPTHAEQGQIERAQRLRAKIDRMKQGLPADDPAKPESLKEQIEDRATKLKKPGK